MSFDFFQKLVSDDGELDEDAAQAYERELLRLFEESPEGRDFLAEGLDSGWVGFLLHYGTGYLGVTPATMTATALDEIVFELFPRKVSCEVDAAPAVIAELRAFFRFAERAFGFARAAECLRVLGDGAEARLKAAFENPRNWGMAKSFVMAGEKAGYDMRTQEGLNAFMLAYNARLEAKQMSRRVPELVVEPMTAFGGGNARDDREERRRRRKIQKAARKRGR